MRKLVVILVAMAIAAPAMATVTFTATDIGGGKLQIGYASDAGELPRSVSLSVSCSDGATADGSSMVSKDGAYNIFMDFAYDGSANYGVGDGHCMAKAGVAGALVDPAGDFSIGMAVADQSGNAAAGPGSTANLVTIQLTGVGTTLVTLAEDSLRGGVLGSQLDVLMPAPVPVVFPVPCEDGDAAFIAEWNAVGNPDCWCIEVAPRQCLGDADNSKQGKNEYAVSTSDLDVLSGAWLKPYSGVIDGGGNHLTVETPLESGIFVPLICADFNHDAQGRFQYRAGPTDLNILTANWQVDNGPADDICQNTQGVQGP